MRNIRAMLALALALAGGGSFAQSVQVADSAFQRFLINTTGVGQQTVGFSGSGQPVPQVSGQTLAPDGGPGVRATATGVLRNPAGGSIPVSLSGRVTPAVVGSLLKRSIPLVGAALLVSDIADFASEQGFDLSLADGSVLVRRPDPNVCSVAPCNEFRYFISDISGTTFGPWSRSYDSACAGLVPIQAQKCPSCNTFLYSVSGPTCSITYRVGTNPTRQGSNFSPQQRTVDPAPAAFTPSSLDAFESHVASQPSFPLSSSVAEAIAQARQLLNEPIPLAQPEVTGPASSPGSTSTTTKPDGSTVTITQTFNHTYNGPNISTTTTTTTSTVPAGGGPVQTETTVQSPDPVQQDPEPFVMPCGVPGAPPCAVKVDETGVLTTVEELANTQDLADQSIAPIDGVEDESFWPSLPDVTFDFALPTACSPLTIPAFAPFLEQVDVCEFQPMFHSIMELVWVLGALFGAIGLFWRNSMNPVPA